MKEYTLMYLVWACFTSQLFPDHTSGLNASWPCPIHCTAVTGKLLIRKFKIDPKLVVSLLLVCSMLAKHCHWTMAKKVLFFKIHASMHVTLCLGRAGGWGVQNVTCGSLRKSCDHHRDDHRRQSLPGIGHVPVWGILWKNTLYRRLQVLKLLDYKVEILMGYT